MAERVRTLLTGRGIRVAVIDSGVHAGHPHVGGVAGGTAFDVAGMELGDYVDRLGHGTAIAAAIREKAPDAALFAVKVFDRSLSTSVTSLVAAIEWSISAGVHLVNLSLGTPRVAHEAALRDAITKARAHDVIVVSARRDDQRPDTVWFPGSLPGVLGVDVDWSIPRHQYRLANQDGVATMIASGYPRDIPGVPPARNVHGVSFSVANATGFAACALEAIAPRRSLDALVSVLRDLASPVGAP